MSATNRAIAEAKAHKAEEERKRAEAAERAAVREAAIRTKTRAASKKESVRMLYGGRAPPPRCDPEELLGDIAKRTRLDNWGGVPLLFGFVPTRILGSKATPNSETFAALRFAGESLIATVKAGDAAGVSLALPHTKRAVYDPHPKVHAEAVARHVDARCDNAAAVNWRDSHGFTALHWACQRGHARVALRLLALGASENGRFANGTTPLQLGRMHGRSEGLEVQMRRIVAQRSQIDRRLLVAAAHGNADEILALLRGNHPLCALEPDAIAVAQVGAAPVLCAAVNAAEPQTRCGGGETALHEAAFFGRDSACGVLLRSGAWLDARCCLGWTALHRACAEGHESTARLLIEAAAAAVDFGALRGAVLPGAAKAGVGEVSGRTAGASDRVADGVADGVADADGVEDDAHRRTALCAFVDAETRRGETALQVRCSLGCLFPSSAFFCLLTLFVVALFCTPANVRELRADAVRSLPCGDRRVARCRRRAGAQCAALRCTLRGGPGAEDASAAPRDVRGGAPGR